MEGCSGTHAHMKAAPVSHQVQFPAMLHAFCRVYRCAVTHCMHLHAVPVPVKQNAHTCYVADTARVMHP